MTTSLRRRFTYANVMSTIAVACLVTGGTAFAAKAVLDGRALTAGSVGASKLAPNSVDSTKVKNRSLLATDFKSGQLPRGEAGAQGPAGARGPEGPAGSPDTSQFYDRVASDARFAARAQQTVYVTGAGTPAENGSRLLEALAAIPAPSDAEHPRLLVLEPGVYDLGASTLAMKDGVSIAGSGLSNTTIKGTASTLVTGADAELRDLTLSHAVATGTATDIAIELDADALRLTRAQVSASATGAGKRYGVTLANSSQFIMREARVVASGGHTAIAVRGTYSAASSTIDAVNSQIIVNSGTVSNQAVQLDGTGLNSFASRLLVTGGAAPFAIGAADPMPAHSGVVRLGSTEVYGAIIAGNNYRCGASFDSADYALLDSNTCG